MRSLPFIQWTPWFPRDEIAPRFSMEEGAGPDGGTALKIEGGGDPAAYGAWQGEVNGIEEGKTYRFSARYRARQVSRPAQCVTAYLDWLGKDRERIAPPDFISVTGGKEGEWVRVGHRAPAPEGTKSLLVRLCFGGCGEGSVVWDEVQFEEVTPPPGRVARIATVFHRPTWGVQSAEEGVASFCRVLDNLEAGQADLICLPEGITVAATEKGYDEVSEPIPGPTTRTLGEQAKRLNAYIVAGIYERVGHIVYNTAVLIGRDGKVCGAYRKTHLPREEVEGGITAGDAYPVFDTDFGRIGLMICWDVQFPEPARAMALKGAEILLLPIWGGNEVLARARAIENHVFLVSSSYDMKTFIVDPSGAVLAEATGDSPIAIADLHLDRKIVQPWVGDMKHRTWIERRPDLSVG